MIASQSSAKAAVAKVRELIGWSPDLGLPVLSSGNAGIFADAQTVPA